MSTSLQYLVHFMQQEFLEIIYYNIRVQSAINKQQNKKTSSGNDTRIHLCPLEESSTQELLLKLHLQQGKINPEYIIYSQDLPN